MTLRRTLIQLHRWLSLVLLAIWLLQSLTGMICVFHWEIDDATIAAPHSPTDLSAIERRLSALAPIGSGRHVTSLWTSAGAADRWDVAIDGPGAAAFRIDGAGNVLRVRSNGERLADGGWIDTAVTLHQTLLAGELGGWIVGLSGVALLSNIVMGLVVALPRPRGWLRALRPRPARRAPARFYGWHRAVGLWAAIPALALVSAGVLRVFSDGFEHLIGARPAMVAKEAPVKPGIPMSHAVSVAERLHLRARLAGIDFPGPDDATWKIMLLAPGEPRRAYGTTTVFVSGNDGSVRGDFPAVTAPAARRLADLVYPIHTGEWAGLPGRLGVFAIGIWLTGMLGLGASLWLVRRRERRAS